MGSDKRKRPTKSLNDDFDDARTGRRGSAKAVKRERASAGSARGRAPQPAAEIEVDDAPIEIDDDDDVFPDEDPDPVATVRPRDIPPNPPSGPDTPRHPSLLVVVSGGANLPRGGTRRAPDHPPPNPPNSRRLRCTCRSSRVSRRSLTCRSSPRRYARAGPVQQDDQPDPISKPKYGHPDSHFPHHRRQQEKHKLVSEVMRYMLFSQYRDGAPVQKPKLSEHLSKVAPELKRAKVSTYVIAEAQVKFNEIFGVEMKELSRKQQKKTGAARTNMQVSEPTKEYVLKSLLSSKFRRQFIDRPEDHTFRGFVMVVVALVSVSGGEIEEDTLWKHLGKLGVRQDDESHPKLGNVRKLLDKLCVQRYLMREKDIKEGQDKFKYSAAERAEDELPQEKVDKYVIEMMRGHDDEDETENAAVQNGN